MIFSPAISGIPGLCSNLPVPLNLPPIPWHFLNYFLFPKQIPKPSSFQAFVPSVLSSPLIISLNHIQTNLSHFTSQPLTLVSLPPLPQPLLGHSWKSSPLLSLADPLSPLSPGPVLPGEGL